jgi:tetratricopeptide (TPR) repeat protein
VPEASNQFIETTCPECHSTRDPGQLPFHEGPRDLQHRVISDVELVGKVYYNRGVAALEAKRFSQATDLLTCARHLDAKDQATHDNLLATLNNWALAACDSGEYETASDLILRGLSIDPSYPPLQSNDLHVHQQWVKSLCNQQQYAAAIAILDTVVRRHPDEKAFRYGRLTVYGRWAESLFMHDDLSAGWNLLRQAEEQINWADEIERAKFTEAQLAAVMTASEKLLQAKQSTRAARLIEQATARFPSQAEQLRRKLHLLPTDL